MNELQSRAQTLLMDKHGLTVDKLSTFTRAEQIGFIEAVNQLAEEFKYNQLKWMWLTEYQKEFIDAGANVARRALIAANRSGKSVATSTETAYHLTGLYPEDHKGLRYPKAPKVYIMGESWTQVSEVTQQELLGVRDIRTFDQVGTGKIPRHLIDMDTMTKDGPNCLSVRVQHVSGDWSELTFKNYNQSEKDLQGFKADLVVFDEQPPDKIWDEMATRTLIAPSGIDVGHIICSFTPLKGRTGVVGKFWNGEEGFWYKRVELKDVPEYDNWGTPIMTEKAKAAFIAGISDPLEIDPRIYGIPSAGAGMVFPWGIDECKFSLTETEMDPNWTFIAAIDPAKTKDKTSITFVAWDEENDVMYAYRNNVFRNRVLPEDYVHLFLEEETREIPVAWPSDANAEGRYTNDGSSLYDWLSTRNVSMVRDPFLNPEDANGNENNRKEPGLQEIASRLKNGKLKIERSLVPLLLEMTSYQYNEKNQSKYDGEDDCIDSLRYAVQSLRRGLGSVGVGGGLRRTLRNQQKFKDIKSKIRSKRNR